MTLVRTISFAAATAVAVCLSPLAAGAVTVSENIFFDDAANNGLHSFTTASGDYLLTPTNFQSSSQCADAVVTPPANGRCLIEDHQGTVTTLTRTNNAAFTLDDFYFLLTGNGKGKANAITVTGSNGATSTFYLGAIFANVTFEHGGAAGALTKDTGYVASFTTAPFDLFTNVTSVTWTAAKDAQIRLDNIAVHYDTPEVPLPAGGMLLAGGLAALAALRRKRNAA